MKKVICGIVALLSLYGVGVWADVPVKIGWDANTEADLAGYHLYRATVSGQYTKGVFIATIPAGTQTITVQAAEGTWFWVLTAFDASGNESGFSNEVTVKIDTTAPQPPKNCKIIP